jgi:hypothetical protein
MYVHHRGLKSVIHGENIIDAIKKRNQNAILVKVFDDDGTEYTVKEHDEVSPDKYFDYYWVDKDNKVLYDEKEDKWGDYYREEKRRIDKENELKNAKPIISGDVKVKIVAYNNKILICPNRPFEDVGDHWYPVDDKGHIGSLLLNSSINLGVSNEALELMSQIQVGSDGIGDIDWYQSDGEGVFSWLCALYRVIDINSSIAARGYRIHADKCVIIENIITDEMINGIKQYDGYRWKNPFSVTDSGIKNYNRKIKLKRL